MLQSEKIYLLKQVVPQVLHLLPINQEKEHIDWQF